jgi:hypothetical protein
VGLGRFVQEGLTDGSTHPRRPTHLSAVPGQVGLVLSLSPEWPDPRPGEWGAYYQWTGSAWRWLGWAAPDADWEVLFFDGPRRVKRTGLGRVMDLLFGTEE